MLQSNLSFSGTVGGIAFNAVTSTTSHGAAIPISEPIPAAKSGTLTTRTDNDTGVISVNTGHGIISTDVVDLYWSDAGVNGSRRNMVATVAGDDITVDGGTGDNLPPFTTPIAITKQTTLAVNFVGNNMKAICFSCKARCIVQLMAGATPELIKSLPANGSYQWFFDSGEPNPIAGDTITSIKVSQADNAVIYDVNIGIAYDPTP